MSKPIQIPSLETERLVLRGPEPGDFALYRDFYATATGEGGYGGPRRPDEAFRRLAADLGHWHLRGFGKWIVCLRDSGEPVGGCGLWHPVGWPSHELTWWLLPGARGKGYAAEASRAVIDHALGELRWDHVETHLRDTNDAARKLAERLGGEVIRRETFPDGVTRNVYKVGERQNDDA